VSASVLLSQPNSIQNFLVTVTEMTTGAGTIVKNKPLGGGHSWFK